jgi:hypothetical protein
MVASWRTCRWSEGRHAARPGKPPKGWWASLWTKRFGGWGLKRSSFVLRTHRGGIRFTEKARYTLPERYTHKPLRWPSQEVLALPWVSTTTLEGVAGNGEFVSVRSSWRLNLNAGRVNKAGRQGGPFATREMGSRRRSTQPGGIFHRSRGRKRPPERERPEHKARPPAPALH